MAVRWDCLHKIASEDRQGWHPKCNKCSSTLISKIAIVPWKCQDLAFAASVPWRQSRSLLFRAYNMSNNIRSLCWQTEEHACGRMLGYEQLIAFKGQFAWPETTRNKNCDRIIGHAKLIISQRHLLGNNKQMPAAGSKVTKH